MAQDRNYISSYRLLKLVRSGATSQIWEVMDEIENRRCALKTPQERYRKDKNEIALLKHEFAVGHELDHPSIIRIFDYDNWKGIPYLALEYFESNNLKQWLRAKQDDKEAQRKYLPSILQQAAEGLNYLHGQGWIHRDIKPDNFLVGRGAQVKLIDFAIADRVKRGLARLLSGKGKIQGTRSYMSPEQIRGEHLDMRSDIYSFGCMMFECFCGRPPYTGGSPDELLQKHLTSQVPRATTHNEEISGEAADLVAQMMSKKRELRPESMQEVIDAFENMRIMKVKRRQA